MSEPPNEIFFSVGEPSGDLHAARVVEELRGRCEMRMTGTGGPAMRQAGAHLLYTLDKMSAIGLVEIASAVPQHLIQYRKTRRLFRAGRCRLAVLVDYPGYNLRLAAAASRNRVPVLYYIPPQLWAWGASRIRVMRKTVTHVAAILPFEAEFFSRRGVPATFVGHPLLDRPPGPTREEARRQLGLDQHDPVLGLFPASRIGEQTRLGSLFRETAMLVQRADPAVRVAMAKHPGLVRTEGDDVKTGPSDVVMAASDAVLCKSGTTTLEAALAGKPLCIAYKVHPVTYRIAARLMTCQHIGLVNLLMNRRVVPEYVQDDAVPDRLMKTMLELLDTNGRAASDQAAVLEEVRQRMGTPGAAGRVGDMAREFAA